MVEKIHKNLEITNDRFSSVEMHKESILTKAKHFYYPYKVNLVNDVSSKFSCCNARCNDFDEIIDEELGFDSTNNNEFDQYINQTQ